MSYLKISMKDNFSAPLMKKLQQAGPRAAHAVAVQVGSDTEPFVPASGAPAGMYNRTQVVDGTIIYPGPYARYLYYGVKMVNRATGKGPAHFFDKFGNEVIMFPKGSKLRPTSEPLNISKAHHERATAKWFEHSKAQNLEKWERKAAEAIDRELDK